MGLTILVLGLVVFLGNHIFVTFRDARARLMARFGKNGYRALFSVIAIVGLALIVWGYGDYRAHGMIPVWSPPAFMRHITVTLMLFAAIFMVAAFIPSHIKMKLKHPMLASVKTWALAHLLVKRRSRLDRAVRFVFGLGRLFAHRRQAARRQRRNHLHLPAGPTTSSWSLSALPSFSRSVSGSIHTSSA